MLNKTSKKVLSVAMAAAMTVNMLPLTAFATESEKVYISISDDGQFVNSMAYQEVSLDDLAAIDLADYELEAFNYDKNGDGINEITALHLYIYTHEEILNLDWSDVTVTGGPGSIYLAGGLFGFEDENLRYNYNGAYPADENGWGFTADNIVLKNGDYLDVAHFSDWNFYMDTAYGFNYFYDGDEITHEYSVKTGEELSALLQCVGGGMGMGEMITAQAEFPVFYGKTLGTEIDSVTTDDEGVASITFQDVGTYYLWCNGGKGIDAAFGSIVSSPAYAKVTVSADEEPEPDVPREAQDVSAVLDATMAKLAATVTEPVFGTNAGEWTVLSLARGGYYAKDNAYFSDYYDRIVETVNTKAASVNMNGALHKAKSTDNSRLIVALSALGKDATSVGDWNLITPYEDFNWIKFQGINGTIWALIALDSNNYETTSVDEKGKSIRQQCVDSILSQQHDDGGWSLMANKTYASDPDVTGMALTALYPYRDQPEVAAAAEEAFACLSEMQHDNGTFASGGSECSESCAWVIVSTTTWGINPDTDSRFIKNGKSVVDALLSHYLEDKAMFEHVVGGGSNAMATDQSCYALVAYDRFMNNQPALYDYSDVIFDKASSEGTGTETTQMTATLGLPQNAEDVFNAVLSIDTWDNEAGYKMIDYVMTVPQGLEVTAVTASERLSGGEVNFNLETESGTLRVAYFDANKNSDLTVSGETFPAELFTISFKVTEKADQYDISVDGMSVKSSSSEEDMIVVNTDNAYGSVSAVSGVTFSAVELYTGDDVDLIPSTKKAVALAVTGISGTPSLTYNDGSNTIEFKYNAEITAKSGIVTYVALVDTTIATANFVNAEYLTIGTTDAASLMFGDSNGDEIINAQDALAAVDCWLRKTDITSDDQILTLNVNGDSRLNTFDALGIVEAFVNGSEYAIVTKAFATNG